jgi:outer membrane protein assembly factor BamB
VKKTKKKTGKKKRSLSVIARKPKQKRRRAPVSLLYVGTRGFVRAVRQSTGRKAWETSLPGTGYELVSLLPDGERVFAGSKGRLFGLDARTGTLLWSNELRGMKYGHMQLATERDSPLIFVGIYGHVVAISKKTGRKKWQTSLPRAGYEIVSLVSENGRLMAGSKGLLFGIDPRRGEIEWTNRLQGLGYEHLALAGEEHSSNDLVLIQETAANAQTPS